MYRAILIDDEEIMRESFHDFIPWNKLGFELIAMLEDGNKALSFLKENEVDLVVTDIKLPFISGLEIAKYVHENLPKTKVIILSGYEDFNYARTAMEYDVKHYLLKNMSISVISNHITEVKEELDSKIPNKEQIKTLMDTAKDHLIKDLILGVISSKDELIKRMDITDFSHNTLNSHCAILNITIHNFDSFLGNKWEFGKSGFNNAIENLFTSNDEYIYSILKNNDSQISVFVSTDTAKDINSIVEIIIDNFTQMFSLSVDINIKKYFNSFYDIIDYNMQKNPSMVNNDDIISIKHLLISYIVDNNYSEAKNVFNFLLTRMSDSNLTNSISIIKDIFESICENIYQDDNILLTDFYNALSVVETNDNLKELTSSFFDDLIIKLNEENLNYNSHIVEKAREYIKDNCLKDISLSDVSNYIFLSPDYLGRLLKKHTNETFTDILLKERMEKAIELLKNDDYKIYEISQMVGYKTTKYFTKLFKKYKGITPTEYRNQLWR